MTLAELRQERAKLHRRMIELNQRAAAEARALSAEEETEWSRLEAELDRLMTLIERGERLAETERELAQREADRRALPTPSEPPSPPAAPAPTAPAYAEVWRRWVRVGMDELAPEERAVMREGARPLTPEQRAQSVGTGAAGGFTVAPEFEASVLTAMALWGGMRAVARPYPTDTGADLTIPMANDTGNVGAILAENTTISGQDVTFSQLVVSVYMYTSKLILVPYQLLQDAAFPLESWLVDRFAERLGRATNAHYTTGTGTGQPYGVVTGAVLGKTGQTGQTTSVIYDDLVDLIHSVDPVYRVSSRFMLADGSLKAIRKLKDSQGRPLWEPSLQAGQPDTLLGYPIAINVDMPAMAANAKSILFGDFSAYWLRDVRGLTLVRLTERYADNLQVGFFAFLRTGGRLIDAGTNPVKYYANSAT